MAYPLHSRSSRATSWSPRTTTATSSRSAGSSSAHLCLDDEKVSRIHSVIEVGRRRRAVHHRHGQRGGHLRQRQAREQGHARLRRRDPGRRHHHPAREPAEAAATNLAAAAQAGRRAGRLHQDQSDPEPVLAPAASRRRRVPQAARCGPRRPSAAHRPASVVRRRSDALRARPRRRRRRRSTRPSPPPSRTPSVPPMAGGRARGHRHAASRKGPLGLVGAPARGATRRVGELSSARAAEGERLHRGQRTGVDFVMGDSKLGGPTFEVVHADGQRFRCASPAR